MTSTIRQVAAFRYRNEGIIPSGTLVAGPVIAAVGTSGLPGVTPPLTAFNVVALSNSGVSVSAERRVVDDFTDRCYLDLSASIAMTAWGANDGFGFAVDLFAEDVLPAEFALDVGVLQSFNIIGIEATAKTAHMFNITLGEGANRRGVRIRSTTNQIGTQIIANLESDSVGVPKDVAIISAGGEFEFSRLQIQYSVTK